MSRYALAMNRRVEHTAQVSAGNGATVHADADEATRELVHDPEHPVALEHDGLAAKEVHAPEAIFGVTDKRQPRRPSAARSRAIVCRQDAVHNGIPRAGLCRVFQCPPGSVGSHGVADAA